MLRFMPGSAVETDRIRILQGMIQLRRDGHFAEVYVDQGILRVRWRPDGPILLFSWKNAAKMVGRAKSAAALERLAGRDPLAKAPASERPQPAQTAKAQSARA